MIKNEKTDLGLAQRTAWTEADVSHLIAMAWQDDIPFEAMQVQLGLSESEVIALMRKHLKAGSFKVWRTRVRGRASKHQSKLTSQDLGLGHQASAATVRQAMADAENDGCPLPPSPLSRESLR